MLYCFRTITNRIVQWVCIALTFTTLEAAASIGYLDLKDVHSNILPRARVQLSPIFGYTFLETSQLSNFRFFHGYFGRKVARHGCFEGINSGFERKGECPQDYTSELVQRLFPSPDGVNLVENTYSADLVSYLTPKAIGQILSRISDLSDEDYSNPLQIQSLKNSLVRILFQNMNPKGYYNGKKLYERKSKKFHQLTEEGSEREPRESNEKWGKLKEELDNLQEIFGFQQAPDEGDSLDIGTRKDFTHLAEMIVMSLLESREPSSENGGRPKYPKFLAEHALLAFFLKKSNTKEDLLKLLDGMEQISPPVRTWDRAKRQYFLSSRHDREDFHLDSLIIDPDATAERFASHPEELIFSAMEEDSRNKNKILVFSLARHSSLQNEKKDKYSDCGETSLRNFFNSIVFDHGVYNYKILIELESKGLRVSPALIEFYRRNPEPAWADLQETRDDWSENVVSRHLGVDYVRDQCEITGGFDSMMELIDRLLYHHPSNTLRADEQSTVHPGALSLTEYRGDKLDLLCFLLSTEGRTWSASTVGSSSDDMEVTFSLNDEPKYKWDFKLHHFQFDEVTKKREQMREKVGEKFVKKYADSLITHRKFGSIPDPELSLLSAWFASEKLFASLRAKHDFEFYDQIQSALPLRNTNEILSAIRIVLVNNHNSNHKLTQVQDRWVQKLIDKLPADDGFTQATLSEILLEGYPFDRLVELSQKNDLFRKTLVSNALRRVLRNNKKRQSIGIQDREMLDQLRNAGISFELSSNHMQSLFYTVEKGNIELLQWIGEHAPKNLTRVDSRNKTLAHAAAEKGFNKGLIYLAERAPSLFFEALLRTGDTPAHIAAKTQNIEGLKTIARYVPRSLEIRNSSKKAPMDLFDVKRFRKIGKEEELIRGLNEIREMIGSAN